MIQLTEVVTAAENLNKQNRRIIVMKISDQQKELSLPEA